MGKTSRVLQSLIGFALGIGLLVVLNQLQVPFYLYYPTTTHTVLISEPIDLYLFLVSSICVPITFVLFSRKLSRSGLLGILAIWVASLVLTLLGQPYASLTLYVTVIFAAVVSGFGGRLSGYVTADSLLYTLAFLVPIEFACLCYWMAASLNPLGRVGALSEQLELNLTFSLFPFAMLMLLLLLFSWLWIPLVSRIPRLQNHSPRYISNPQNTHNLRLVVASLDFFAILAILVFFYPYLAGQTWVVGVDSILRYLGPLNELAGVAPLQAFTASYQHGLYIALLYLVQLISGSSAFSVVKFAPLILTIGTAAAIFLAMLRVGWGFELAILSSVCALLWFPVTMGIYAGIQANWLAFLLWMLFLSFYFASPEWNLITFISQGLISLAIFLIHPWSWGVFLASLALTTIISRGTGWKKSSLHGLLAALIMALPIGLAAYLLLPGVSYDFISTYQLYTTAISHLSLSTFGDTFTSLFYDWGSFLSPALLLISLVGAYALTGRGGIAKNYLVAWTAIWCVGSILTAPLDYNPGNFAVSEPQLWRMLYLSPLPILLALGVEWLLNVPKILVPMHGSGVVSRKLLIFLCVPLVALGVGLFLEPSVILRFGMVLGAMLVLLFLVTRFPKYQIARILIASVLILVLVNAAYRSMYPLLLDPHNLIPPGTPGTTGGR
jgi:hypothetical protein